MIKVNYILMQILDYKIMSDMKLKHTPGPWNFHMNGDGSYSLIGDRLGKKEFRWIIAFSQNGEIFLEEQIANAKLIASAPELLSCCMEMRDFIVSNMDSLPNSEKIRLDALKAIVNAIGS